MKRESVNLGSPTQKVDLSSALGLDFNPRKFVVKESLSTTELHTLPDVYLDAIFVPFRGRSEYVSELLTELSYSETPIYLLPTSQSDLAILPKEPRQSIEYLGLDDLEFLAVWQRLECLSNRLSALNSRDWDLPMKRSYALWFARRHHFKKILLVDDDIRGLHSDVLKAGANALQESVMSGLFVEDFPDTSAIGHVEIALGEAVWTFLSGSCLFVRTDVDLGFFPPIYNEDWLFMAHEIARGRVSSTGSIQQKPHDPFLEPSIADFQEPGEIIADGLFALLACDRFDQRLHHAVWDELLNLRRKWLAELACRSSDAKHHAIIEGARAKCRVISESDCVRFLRDWEQDQTLWMSKLKELE